MKTQESGMPPEEVWAKFFNPSKIFEKLKLTSACCNLLEFGCGYGTFTLPAAHIVSGTVHAVDIESELLSSIGAKADALKLKNIELHHRDFVTDGSGLESGSVDYVMLFNILHAQERIRLLKEASRVLSPNGLLAVIHWNYDPTTPRGPSMNIRPRPSDCIKWAETVGFQLHSSGVVDLPPYHYGMLFS